MNLVKLRNDYLVAVAEHPIHPWPGPPPGLENRPSASYMGEHACKRKAYYKCLYAMGKLMYRGDYWLPAPATPGSGGNEIAAQRGWILEESVLHWLRHNGIEDIDAYHEEDVRFPRGNPVFYGHPDGEGTVDGVETLLEIKHQNAMRYMDFLRGGTAALQSPYYAQVQAYMLATGLKQTLLVAMSADPSSVKGDITWGKRRKTYQGELEPDFMAIQNCSGVNPFVYMEIIPANKPYQKGLVAWATDVTEHVDLRKTPDRGFDFDKGWQCRAEWCEYRAVCEAYGPPTAGPEPERGVAP